MYGIIFESSNTVLLGFGDSFTVSLGLIGFVKASMSLYTAFLIGLGFITLFTGAATLEARFFICVILDGAGIGINLRYGLIIRCVLSEVNQIINRT